MVSSHDVGITNPPVLAAARGRVWAFVELTKPRIIELLLVTTVPAMMVAADGWPGLGLVVATLVGGSFSAGGANVINNVIDRDIDRIMLRTRGRPLPTGRVSPQAALVFGIALGLAGFALLWGTTNLLAALLATAGLLFYVFVYTLWLKRMSPQNIVIGGAAGAVPPLVGWAAVAGTLALPAWVMFGVVFLWTPPHFWALALRYEDDYAKAGVPMLPVVVGRRGTLARVFGYTVALVVVSLLLHPTGEMGLTYLLAAVALGAWIVAAAWRLRSRPGETMWFFGFSNLYLSLLFLAIAIDRVIN